MSDDLRIRSAVARDVSTIADFNCRMAWETEQKELVPQTVQAGVAAVLAEPARGRYFLAEREQEVIGQLLVTYEWSDWRNGDLWWVQSVFFIESQRRQGVFRQLMSAVQLAAESAGNVVGLRLYVERENRRAQQTYAALGWTDPGYLVREKMLDRE